MSLFRKIVSGDDRKSRLHDALGRRVTISRLMRNGTRAVSAAIANKITGWRPARPWIAYDGQALIDRHLRSDARILEFGSGMSTRWYAQRAVQVISHESNPEWHALVSRQLEQCSNVVLLNRAIGHGYHEIDPLYADTRFDFVMVDGYDREQCVLSGLKHLASGGMLYLDNSDMVGSGPMGDVQE
ncbi:MAG: hypothetical protein HKN78_09705, partial [Sphingomonadaceae bacterium]|nr:hypothetical protein [Sphingomonadaceae bacterium]